MKIALKNNESVKIYNGQLTFEALSLFIKKEFNLSPSGYTLTYVDEDGDNITLASNEDMSAAHELNSEKPLLKVRVNAASTQEEVEQVAFEVIQESPVLQEEVKEQPKKEESPLKEEGSEKKWHKWGHWGGRRSHHNSSSESSSEKHHGRMGGFGSFYHMINESIAEKVDQRVKTLIPCLKAQLEGGSFLKTFSVANPLVHENTDCKSCFATPIVGIRYKCLVCPSFSLCQNCEPIVEHEHNLMKMKKVEEANNHCEFPFKFFKKFWKHQRGERGNSQGSERCGEHKITRKLEKIFRGEPQSYDEFVKNNPSLRKFELISKYATENGFTDKLVNFRCEKIAKRLNKQPQEFKKIVEENLNLKPREVIKKLIENGSEVPPCFKWGKWGKFEGKCRRSQEGKERSKQHHRRHHERPSCEQKFSKQSCEAKLNQTTASFGSSERTEKGVILQALIGLFGSKNVKEYFNLIEQHFSMGQEAIINKWLEIQCSNSTSA